MRKFLFGLFLFYTTSLFAALPFNKMVFFGDSLSDNGNLYRTLFKIIPKSPPYYEGRFSNGPVWAELLAADLQVEYADYAVGGATAIFHRPRIQFTSPALLECEVDKYLIENLGRDKSNILYSFWIGANDYMYGLEKDPSQFAKDIVNKEMSMINRLVEHGAKYFLVLNLPDLARIPAAGNDDVLKKRYHQLIIANNEQLTAALDEFKKQHSDVKIYFIDIYSFFNNALDNTQSYNKMFNINITDTIMSCWSGGYTLQGEQSVMAMDMQQTLNKRGIKVTMADANSMANYIINSPGLLEAYNVGKQFDKGYQPCSNPDEHLFWDHVHPTAVIHRVLAQIAAKTLQEPL